MKKLFSLILICLLCVTAIVLSLPSGGVAAYAEGEKGKTYSVICAKAYAHKVGAQVAIYVTPDKDGEVLKMVDDGVTLELIEIENSEYYQAVFDNGEGYVLKSNTTTGLSYNQRLALAIGLICFVTLMLILGLTYYNKNKNYFIARRKGK